MRKGVVFIAAAIILLILFFIFRNQAIGAVNKVLYYSPCDEPLRYKIGTIDSRFKVTTDELKEDAVTAANIWNTTQNKQLFMYDPEATFTINMVYDDRQKLTSEITSLNNDLMQKQSEIDPKISEFKKRQAEFERKIFDLNDRIKYWNERGGAPPEEYDKLVAEQRQLQQEASSLNQTAEELGQSTEEYNQNARQLNQTINDFKDVLEFRPEEGLYEQEGGMRKISIYIDVDEAEFLHTLAHEMGHALGLDHTDDPESIMYPQTTTVLSPSPEEIAQLERICEHRTIFEIAAERMTLVIALLQQRMSGVGGSN